MSALLDIERQVKIWVSDIPKRFITLLERSDPLAVYIASPWITEFIDPQINLIDCLKRKNTSLILLTRPPQDQGTESYLNKLKAETRTRIYTNPRLHAKVYVIEGVHHKHVILGSANFTEEARGNIEVALHISGSDLITKRIIYSFLGYLKPMCNFWR